MDLTNVSDESREFAELICLELERDSRRYNHAKPFEEGEE